MKRLALIALLLALAVNKAQAENCGRSREYLLGNLGGELALPPKAYEDLSKTSTSSTPRQKIKGIT